MVSLLIRIYFETLDLLCGGISEVQSFSIGIFIIENGYLLRLQNKYEKYSWRKKRMLRRRLVRVIFWLLSLKAITLFPPKYNFGILQMIVPDKRVLVHVVFQMLIF